MNAIAQLKADIAVATSLYNELSLQGEDLWSERHDSEPQLAIIKPYVVGSAKIVQWHKPEKKLPREGQTVVAKYEGVYGPRIVTYWNDGASHFGEPPCSEPITHWKAFCA